MGIQQPIQDVRPSPIAGKWYPGDAPHLSHTIDEFISRAEVPDIPGRIVGILAPHAGHRYSGPVAGHAYKLLQGKTFDTVVLVGPSHYPYPSHLITSGHEAFETPLGQVPIDRPVLEALQQRLSIETVRKDPEHSLEIQLPFLQCALGRFRLVPLALVDQSFKMAEELGHAIGQICAGTKTLLVASSDLSHFYPQQVAHVLDQTMLDTVAAFEPAQVIQAEEEAKGFACGRGAIAAVMVAARDLGADTAQVINYATSGDITHDYGQVVGYGAAVFYQKTTAYS
jgi:MEMO1 family protein